MPKSYRSTAAKPFLRWIGGKQKLIGSLLEKLPDPHSFDRYFEPFLGAGSLFLACGFRNAILNDLNAPLINSYKQVRDCPATVHNLLLGHSEAFKAAGQGQRDGRNYYYQVRDRYNQDILEESPEQAARFIFLIHANYNGVYRVNQKGLYNTPFGMPHPRTPSLEELCKVSDKLQNSDLRVGYYHEVLSEIREGDFVYLDPPYPILSKTARFTAYTIDRFAEQDHRELADFAMKAHRLGALVMISISLTPLVEELYRRGYPWRYNETNLKRTISSKNPPLVVRELILTNYKPHGLLDLE